MSRARTLRGDQIQTALFSDGGASRCQRRLTLLVGHRYLDRLPRRLVTHPAIYLLTRRSVPGNGLVRERWGEEESRRRMVRLGSLGHLLAVNDVRVRVERGCTELGWSLQQWRSPEELARLLRASKIVPDAYFQIQRATSDGSRTAALSACRRSSRSRRQGF